MQKESTIFVNDLVMWIVVEPRRSVGEELLSNSFGTLNKGLLTLDGKQKQEALLNP